MAKKKAAAAGDAATAYEPEATYVVALSGPVPFGRMTLRPCDDVRLKGKFIAGLGDKVLSATKV